MNCENNVGAENGRRLNLMAAAFANAISEGMSIDEMELLSTFLQAVGEGLALIAVSQSACENKLTNFPE